jgi:GTP-binding protein
MLDDNRCIVSPIPGTTRDSIDTPFTIGGESYTLIDTAGIRRKTAEHEVVDKFAAIRTQRSIERADICLLILDAQEGLTTQEKRIATTIEEAGKGCILLMNKWDLIKGFRMEHCQQAIEARAPFLTHCPIIFGSAKTGRNVDAVIEAIQTTAAERTRRIPTPELNKLLIRAMHEVHPPMITGKRLRIYYMTQIGIAPPRFLLFVNFPHLLTPAYKKYLHNQLRKSYPFCGNPVIFEIKGKERGPKQTSISSSLEEESDTGDEQEAEELSQSLSQYPL